MPEPLHAYFESALNLLERDAEKNRARYATTKPWADPVPGAENTSFPTNVVPRHPLVLAMPNERDKLDAENARTIHSALPRPHAGRRLRSAVVDLPYAHELLDLHARPVGR